MYPRTNYEMTEEDMAELLRACKPTPVMFLSGGIPIGGSPQENANSAWASLGKKMGFDHMTVRPIDGKGQRFFSAIPSENEEARNERLLREKEEWRQLEITRLTNEISEKGKELEKLTNQDFDVN